MARILLASRPGSQSAVSSQPASSQSASSQPASQQPAASASAEHVKVLCPVQEWLSHTICTTDALRPALRKRSAVLVKSCVASRTMVDGKFAHCSGCFSLCAMTMCDVWSPLFTLQSGQWSHYKCFRRSSFVVGFACILRVAVRHDPGSPSNARWVSSRKSIRTATRRFGNHCSGCTINKHRATLTS